MELIKKIEISGLRSIQSGGLDDVGSFNALVGKNSSGKSNALRALNLFFNGVIEPGKTLDFPRDHYEQLPRIKKKKRISVSIDFSLPRTFKFRKGLEPLYKLGEEFRIRKSWELDQLRNPVEHVEVFVEGQRVPGGEELARQFLYLITYRYVPNRTIPSDILRNESQAIANSIFGRMKGDQHSAALLRDLTAAASRMLEDARESLNRASSPLTEPSVSTAESIGEMLTMSGFQATGTHGLAVQDEDWGAGHQAFFLYQILKTLDTSYGRFFGWKQATIWGVEEPEAGLHRDLETQLAENFREMCLDESLRMQIFATTHSPIFSMASDSGNWVELEKGETKIFPLSIPELTYAAETRGVSGWVHPILYFPWNPVVLTEGAIDAEVLGHVAKLAGFDHLRFVSLPDIDSQEKRGGKDKIIAFLKRSGGMLKNRPKRAPLMVLFDWDVSNDQLAKARGAYGNNSSRYVMKMDKSHCGNLLGKEFKGIERFYPPEVFLDSHKAGELILGVKEGRPYSISSEQLTGAKRFLMERVIALDRLDKLEALLLVVMDIDRAYRQDYPAQMNLKGL